MCMNCIKNLFCNPGSKKQLFNVLKLMMYTHTKYSIVNPPNLKPNDAYYGITNYSFIKYDVVLCEGITNMGGFCILVEIIRRFYMTFSH